ncbi:uncharacterized protein LOC121729684 [Aricia agestis]|uniref:uncharacterized protein LOC121729684 n=1 Tax=Aricia agestis TaxID=91739 RepID=UPI001C203DF3|nr:uncharacterized protein LOC121729684 [Aricia agestis]
MRTLSVAITGGPLTLAGRGRSVTMWAAVVLVATLALGHCHDATQTQLAHGEQRMSEYIMQVLDHFKQPNPEGLPGAEVPDPYMVPNMQQSITVATLYFKNTTLHGLSKFKILYVNAEISSMKVVAGLAIDHLEAVGNCTISTWISRVNSPYTVNIKGIKVTATANLGVERDGKIRAQDMNIDIAFSNIDMNIANPGMLGGLIQNAVNTMGSVLFDSIKPYVLKEAYVKARTEINNKLDEFSGDMEFPNSISPLDMVISDLRKKVREMNFDPYKVNDYNTSASIFTMTLSNTWLTGISSFHRVGNITLMLVNNTVLADFEIGTQKLEGMTHWEISALNGITSRAGSTSFSVEYISGRIVLGQPLDTRKKPEFRDLDLDVGNIQVRFDGAGTLDYAVEFIINILPNLLRYQIVNALEGPIQDKIQQELNSINVEEMIIDELPKIDELQENGFKLDALKPTALKEDMYGDDDFFNF